MQIGNACFAAELDREYSTTIRGDLYSSTVGVPGSGAADKYQNLKIGAAAAVNHLFDVPDGKGSMSDVPQSRRDNEPVSHQIGSNSILETTQSGANNRLSITQSDSSTLFAIQRGYHNEIQSEQSGRDNFSRLDQSGSYNTIIGFQSGSGNTATITQVGQYQAVVYAQSGTASTLTVRQR
ncbi:hypothetical protein ABIE45_000611 [Methylobacterium sp. OAE515]|uniref:hypothetical protein n=1 Tax=Methylobacterium sp. OAE515 TaxID=2817895 RepID=UPI0017891014